MSYPAGVQTVTLRLGSSFDSAGTLASITGHVMPMMGAGADHLVWTATGQTYAKVRTALEWDDAEKVAYAVVPHPSQAGWKDQTQASFSGWSYQITAVAAYASGERHSFERTVTPQAGDTVIDVDLLPNGVAATPTVVAEWEAARADALAALAAKEVEQVTLTDDLAYTFPAGASPNRVHSVVFMQDATGGHTVTYGGQPITVDQTAGAVTTVELHPAGAGYVVRYPGKPPAARRADALATPLRLITDALDAGVSLSMQVIGDSTGNGADEWPYLVAADMAARYPGHTVEWRLWSDAIQGYARPTVIQTGAGGRAQVTIAGASVQYWSSTTLGALTGIAPSTTQSDLDVRVLASLPDWTPAAVGTLAAQFGSPPQRGWRFQIGPGGILRIDWTEDGTTPQPVALSTVGVPFTDGAEGWVRVTLDADNGASGHEIKFYTSTDGVTWTQLGATVARAGTTTLAATTGAALEVGARGGTAEVLTGATIYEVEFRDGISGPIIAPVHPSEWTPYIGFSGTVAGAPILTVWNGSHGGATIDYLNARVPALVPAVGQVAAFVSCSHNEAAQIGQSYRARLATLASAAAVRLPHSTMCLLTQNPRKAPAAYIAEHAKRRVDVARLAVASRYAFVDVMEAFTSRPGGYDDLVLADGIHPTPAGSRLWAATVISAIDGTI